MIKLMELGEIRNQIEEASELRLSNGGSRVSKSDERS